MDTDDLSAEKVLARQIADDLKLPLNDERYLEGQLIGHRRAVVEACGKAVEVQIQSAETQRLASPELTECVVSILNGTAQAIAGVGEETK